MNFGEIVEPSTRALTEDDYEDYPDDTAYTLEWQGIKEAPEDLTTLIFLESDKIIKIFKKSMFHELKPICELMNGGVKVYCKDSDVKGKETKYVVAFERKKLLTCGQIVMALSEWIQKARQIVTLTSAPISTYQNGKINNESQTFIKMLRTNNVQELPYEKLEAPNLITGLGACVLSYCVHVSKECTSFIAYMDSSPIDSVNSHGLFVLMSHFGISSRPPTFSNDIPSSNLYM